MSPDAAPPWARGPGFALSTAGSRSRKERKRGDSSFSIRVNARARSPWNGVAARLEEGSVVEGLGVGGGHRSMAKGIIPLKTLRDVYGNTRREQIESALLDAFMRAIRE